MSRDRAGRLVVAALLAAFVGLAIASLAGDSQTFDEGVHLTSGFTLLARGDHRLSPEHPPLPRLLGALPLWLAGARFDFQDPSWVEASRWRAARRFFYQWNDADRLLLLGRLPGVALGALLVLAVAAEAHRRWGPGPGLLALLLAATSPELLAHARLATNDLALAAFSFLAVTRFERVLERATPARVLLAGAALGAAFASKFSAIALAAVLPALALVAALGARRAAAPDPAQAGARDRGRGGPVAVVGLLLATALVALVTVWLAYGLQRHLSPDPAWRRPLPAPRLAGWRGGAAELVRGAGRAGLVPEAFAWGVLDQLERTGGRRAFLMGERSNRGFWSYFPVSFAIKTPLGLLGLLALSALVGLRSRGDPRRAAGLLLPIAGFAGLALVSRVDIGFRYLLPLHPFLLVAAAAAAAPPLGRARRAAAGALALAAAGSSLAVHPHYLAYFNEAIGGPSQGYRYLVDSNLDWGQDLKRLAHWLERERPGGRVRLSYFGTAEPGHYGIRATLLPGSMRPAPSDFGVAVLPGDLVCVSVTNLQGVYLPRAVWPLMERLREQRPIATIGHSIHVYRVAFRWLLRPDLAAELGWLEQALASYREAVADDPGAVEAWGYLGLALQLKGHDAEALVAFAEAERLDADHFLRHDPQRRARAAARAALEAARTQ